MRLTSFTDYSLRVLIYLGTQSKQKLSSIREISDMYRISNNHLTKVVYGLGKLGLVETIRGRNGGIRLAKKPEEINIGWVVRQTEEELDIVECFNDERNQCIISPACRLKGVLKAALEAYLKVLDQYTLADLLVNADALKEIFEGNQ